MNKAQPAGRAFLSGLNSPSHLSRPLILSFCALPGLTSAFLSASATVSISGVAPLGAQTQP